MGRITERLAGASRIAVDTAIFVYHLEAHPVYLHLTREIFTGIEQGRWQGVTSTITLVEINVRPIQLGYLEIARQYETLLVNFPNLSINDIDRKVARTAARIRADFRVRPPDALQISTALVSEADAFLTNDQQLRRLQPVIDIVILADFV